MSDAVSLGEDLVSPSWEPPVIDSTKAHPARIYDYLLGGKDNFPIDREAAEVVLKAVPQARASARANREFLGRAVRSVAEAGVTQFLDVGTGIPGPGSTGETARALVPDARIVYVDYDPIVSAHSRALLAGADPSLTAVIQADVRDPASILENRAVRTVLDFDRPVAVLMVALLHFVRDDEDPVGIVRAFTEAVAPGSHLVVSHATGDFDPERTGAATRGWKSATSQVVLRSHADVSALFGGLEILEPGVVLVPKWRPDEPPQENDRIWLYGGVGTKI